LRFCWTKFWSFATNGLSFKIHGNCNDYLGKGLSRKISIKVPLLHHKPKEKILWKRGPYGAITGEAYINGMAGERFSVRNSGATAVVEGIGDLDVIYDRWNCSSFGKTGRNFAAGNEWWVAYIFLMRKNNENGNGSLRRNVRRNDLRKTKTFN
jgi:glutamate synthase (ferredoxin)